MKLLKVINNWLAKLGLIGFIIEAATLIAVVNALAYLLHRFQLVHFSASLSWGEMLLLTLSFLSYDSRKVENTFCLYFNGGKSMPFKQINFNEVIQQKRKSEDFNSEYFNVKKEYNHLETLMDQIIDENKKALLELNEQNSANESSESMNIEIVGHIDVTNNPVSIDEMNDMFIEWIEANGWYFGGVMKDATDSTESK